MLQHVLMKIMFLWPMWVGGAVIVLHEFILPAIESEAEE